MNENIFQIINIRNRKSILFLGVYQNNEHERTVGNVHSSLTAENETYPT